jgi:hypothetical protein
LYQTLWPSIEKAKVIAERHPPIADFVFGMMTDHLAVAGVYRGIRLVGVNA